MQLKIFGLSDVGLVRTSNQDNYFYNESYGIVIVSDGMGGHKGGEIASNLVVNGLKDAFLSTNQLLLEDIGFFLDNILQKINNDILEISQQNKNLEGMGATVNYLQFAGGSLAIGHAGDSRTYLIRPYLKKDGQKRYGLWLLTIDHNVGTFLNRGLINPKQYGIDINKITEKQKARLTCGMGVIQNLKADLYLRKIKEGDIFLTCSDGLHGYVKESDILQAIVSGEIHEAPARLIALAKQVGAPDNVTVVVSFLSSEKDPLVNFQTTKLLEEWLIRTEDKKILGPYTFEQIIKKWQFDEITPQIEVAKANSIWINLFSPKLFNIYPQFNIEEFNEKYRLLFSDNIKEKKTFISLSKIKILIFYLALLFVSIAVLLYFFYN